MDPISLIQVSVDLLFSLYQLYRDNKEKAELLRSLRLRVERIQNSVGLTSARNTTSYPVYIDVAKKIVKEFISINSRLQKILRGTENAPVVRRVLNSSNTLGSLKEVEQNLDTLERHLDNYGMLRDIRHTLQVEISRICHEICAPSSQQVVGAEKFQARKHIQSQLQSLSDVGTLLSPKDKSHGNTAEQDPSRTEGVVTGESLDLHEKNTSTAVASIQEGLQELSTATTESELPLQDRKNILAMVKSLRRKWYVRPEDIELQRGKDGKENQAMKPQPTKRCVHFADIQRDSNTEPSRGEESQSVKPRPAERRVHFADSQRDSNTEPSRGEESQSVKPRPAERRVHFADSQRDSNTEPSRGEESQSVKPRPAERRVHFADCQRDSNTEPSRGEESQSMKPRPAERRVHFADSQRDRISGPQRNSRSPSSESLRVHSSSRISGPQRNSRLPSSESLRVHSSSCAPDCPSRIPIQRY